MDDTQDRRLILWSLGTFHTGLLVLLLVIFIYRFGNLAGALKNVGTIPGVALFVALWISTCFTTGHAVRRSEWALDRVPPLGRALEQGAAWGGFNGILFFLCLLVYLVFSAIAEGRGPDAGNLLLILLGGGLAGSIPAFIVGSFIGIVFATLDVMLFAVASRIYGACVEIEEVF